MEQCMADRIGSNGDPSQQNIELAANSTDYIAICKIYLG